MEYKRKIGYTIDSSKETGLQALPQRKEVKDMLKVEKIVTNGKIRYKVEKGVTIKALENDFYVSDGNKKLVSNAETLFLIWNLPAKITCPYATELCKISCYAIKAEINYPDCLPCRKRNFEFSKSDNFVDEMIAYIAIKLNNLKNGRKIIFRIHESGDFYNKAYFMKWLEIIRFFDGDTRIIFVCYTKSVRFLVNTDFASLKAFTVRFSIWEDTKETEKEIARQLNLPIYTAYERSVIDDMLAKGIVFHECRCSDCATCLKCFDREEKLILCEIH